MASCIVCGRTDISGEHIWAEWMHEYIPRSPEHRYVRQTLQTARANPRIRGVRRRPCSKAKLPFLQRKHNAPLPLG
jgi:hypothetical protein